MAEIKKLILLFSLLSYFSCNEDKQLNNKYHLVFTYEDWATIDYKTKILTINYAGLKYKDTLHFTQQEDDVISNSFNKNNIGDIKGEKYFADGYAIMPPVNLKMKLFYNDKLQSEMIVDWQCKKGNINFSQKYRAVSFKEDFLKILEKNSGFIKASSVFITYQKDKKFFGL